MVLICSFLNMEIRGKMCFHKRGEWSEISSKRYGASTDFSEVVILFHVSIFYSLFIIAIISHFMEVLDTMDSNVYFRK